MPYSLALTFDSIADVLFKEEFNQLQIGCQVRDSIFSKEVN